MVLLSKISNERGEVWQTYELFIEKPSIAQKYLDIFFVLSGIYIYIYVNEM